MCEGRCDEIVRVVGESECVKVRVRVSVRLIRVIMMAIESPKMPLTDPRARERSVMGIPITDSRGTAFP